MIYSLRSSVKLSLRSFRFQTETFNRKRKFIVPLEVDGMRIEADFIDLTADFHCDTVVSFYLKQLKSQAQSTEKRMRNIGRTL